MAKKRKGKWGGARPGSGPKPKHGSLPVTYSVRLTVAQAELVKQWGGGDLSAGMRWLIEAASLWVIKNPPPMMLEAKERQEAPEGTCLPPSPTRMEGES